jgi:hypothetical protein
MCFIKKKVISVYKPWPRRGLAGNNLDMLELTRTLCKSYNAGKPAATH